jgi:Family of unknown function (DUF6496)
MALPMPSPIRQNPIVSPRTTEPAPTRPIGSPVRAEPLPVRASPSPGVRMAVPSAFRRGGRVERTGWAKVHKGETVLPAAEGLGKGKTKTPRRRKIKKTMDEWKGGALHSGSKKGPVVRNQKQAIAIALSQARKEK